MEINIGKLNFVPVGNQDNGDEGYYKTIISQENRGLYMVNCYSYQAEFHLDRNDTIIPESLVLSGVDNYLHKELAKLYLPYLQEKVDKSL